MISKETLIKKQNFNFFRCRNLIGEKKRDAGFACALCRGFRRGADRKVAEMEIPASAIHIGAGGEYFSLIKVVT